MYTCYNLLLLSSLAVELTSKQIRGGPIKSNYIQNRALAAYQTAALSLPEVLGATPSAAPSHISSTSPWCSTYKGSSSTRPALPSSSCKGVNRKP